MLDASVLCCLRNSAKVATGLCSVEPSELSLPKLLGVPLLHYAVPAPPSVESGAVPALAGVVSGVIAAGQKADASFPVWLELNLPETAFQEPLWL